MRTGSSNTVPAYGRSIQQQKQHVTIMTNTTIRPIAIASTIENRKYRMNRPAWDESSVHNSRQAVKHRLRRRNMARASASSD
jgi:hypothetical protein